MKKIILQQKEERDILMKIKYQQRFFAEDISIYLASNLIKLITGPRRAGKSVFALQLLQNESFAYLNFDDDLLLSIFNEDEALQVLQEVYPDFRYLLLDEIQNLSNWEVWVSKLYRRGINLIITGSNARLLSSEMATVLTGRYLQIEILPFSFSETLSYRNIEAVVETPTKKANLLLQLDDYMTYGGFPETINMRNIVRNYLSSLFDSILLKDITKRFKVRNTNELYNLSNYLLINYCNPFSISQLTADLELGSKTTTQKFCRYLEETYLFFYLPRFDNKFKIMQKAPLKPYIVDNGFVQARSFEHSPNKGRLLENLVFIELLRRGYEVGKSLFYYHTRNNKEVDFVCKIGHKVQQLIQVSYDITNAKTQKREIGALIEAMTELNCDNCLIITWDNEQKNDNIVSKPLYKWLLNLD